MLKDTEANLVRITASDIQIVGVEAGQDKVKTLGRWEVDFRVGGDLAPVRKTMEVVPL